jgi:hypothetical protein
MCIRDSVGSEMCIRDRAEGGAERRREVSIIAKSSGDGKTFDPAPIGVHQAVCVDVVDLGVLETNWQGQVKKQHKINVAWQINEDRDDGKPFLVFKRYTLSLHEKAGLRKDLESWRGRAFTTEECAGFDVERLLGVNCLLNITHRVVEGKTYANVNSVMPTMKGMPTLSARDYIRKVDRVPETSAPVTASPQVELPPDNGDPDSWEPLTDDDIPFAWLMPLLLPLLATGVMFA